ncbi:MAG TPA: type IV toxin-antitoxin system AbiEi family antitoxin domain-containing protein [Nocardioidaceae bacterium]|nr:type IV toxin-antitoxin system AbiEi family antitoxin domain-containing protein [Nocardioidaceae bacterium]
MDRLRAHAESRGFFTRSDVLADGHDDRAIRRAVRQHLWVRLRPGTYTFRDLWPDDAQQRHCIIGRAVAAKLGPSVTLSHTTAALLHGLHVWDADLSLVHVTRLDGGAGRTECHVAHHEGLILPSDLRTVDGALVTHPARAAIETASLLSTEAGLVSLDAALASGLTNRLELDATFALMRSWPGMLGVQLAVRMADPGAQSAGESRIRYLCYAAGLPAPVLQHEVRDRSGRLLGVTDFAWPRHGLLGEFDGKVKYGRYLRPGETPGDAVFREKRREDAICEQLGWRMIRFVWADLHRPADTAARIGRMLRLAA